MGPRNAMDITFTSTSKKQEDKIKVVPSHKPGGLKEPVTMLQEAGPPSN